MSTKTKEESKLIFTNQNYGNYSDKLEIIIN